MMICMQKKEYQNLRTLRRMLALVLCVILLCTAHSAFADPGQKMREKYDVNTELESNFTTAAEYASLLASYRESGYLPGINCIATDRWISVSLENGHQGYAGDVFIWCDEQPSVSAEVYIETAGLYVFAADYITYPSDIAQIQRGVLIDGASPCADSENCPFPRIWEEAEEPVFDANGDEKAPAMRQISRWQKQYFCDTNALYAEPLQFYLSAGTHIITLTHVSGDMGLGALYVEPLTLPPDYETYLAAHSAPEYTGAPIIIEAEAAAERSERTIRRIYDADVAASPHDDHAILLNVIGGDRWKSGWQSITWRVNVPETAYYRIDLRLLQNTGEGLTIYRRLLVDGETPFLEAMSIPFVYSKSWQTLPLGNENAFSIYLMEGQHEITLQVVSGELSGIILALKQCSADLSTLLMNISTIVGSSPDTNFDYELHNKIPWLLPTLTSLRDTLQQQAEQLHSLTGKQTTLVANLYSAVEELEGYIDDPDTIPSASGGDGELTVMQTNLATWYGDLLQCPMIVDTMTLAGPNSEINHRSSTFFQRARATWLNFLASFSKDYNSIGDSAEKDEADKTISVWIARGREWGEILQQMCDEEYTPLTGVKVEINILPSGSVGVIGGVSPILLSLVSGDAPNIAIGSDSGTPVELAIRETVVDLSQMPGYDKLSASFVAGALEPLHYNGGVYALPETMDFQFLFYRTDVLDRLQIGIPDTWQELYTRILPTLKQNNYDFYIPITTSASSTYQYCAFYTYLYQRGGDIYAADGLSTTLDTEESYAAFNQWVQNYTRYNLPREINVFNHFRTGDIPMFIGGLNDYLTLKVAAPELYGKWDIALVPGTQQEDGGIDRSAIGALSTCMIFDKGEEENLLAWDFLRWYMSADVQYRYGDEVEAQVGLQARWFTANTEAFRLLPWESKDLTLFGEAMQWMRNPRNVLGGYITGRQINNAWTRAVMNGQSPMESLEDAIREIDRELLRKQEEYGIGGTK